MDLGSTFVQVVRRDIKHLHVGVYPPNGRVRVAAPLRMDDNTVRIAVIERLGWIRRKQLEFAQQERQSQREFVSGESHYFEGQRYLLEVIEGSGRPFVSLRNKRTITLGVRPGSDRATREAVLNGWYRAQLRGRLPSLVSKWEPRIAVRANEVRIRMMKTRWGSCNSVAGRIWLNLELAKKPVSCLEYVLVHELVHLVERRHNERFRELMDRHMPQWRLHRDTLNHAPLAHAHWKY